MCYRHLKGTDYRSFVNGQAKGKSVGVHAQDGFGDLQGQLGPLCKFLRAGQKPLTASSGLMVDA
jgi:hypothetical protein